MNPDNIFLPITEGEVFSRIRPRPGDSHKGSFGKLTAICGSACYRGAAVLACMGALRSGAGIVCMAGVEPVLSAVLSRFSEPTLFPLPMAAHGGISSEAIPQLEIPTAGASAVLAGCGMGNTEDTLRIVAHLIGEIPYEMMDGRRRTLILDADALNALSRDPGQAREWIRAAGTPVILTPHIGEFSRLSGLRTEAIKEAPAEVAARFAADWGCVLVLKDAVTHVASPDGRIYRNTTGNPGLSRGGSGDVLAGIIASLAAQGLAPIDAAVCGVWLHGAAADDCAARLSMAGMLPSDLASGLCNVFREHGR